MDSARVKWLLLLALAGALALLLGSACGSKEPPTTTPTPTTPPIAQGYVRSQTCKMCHSLQFEAWSQSLHSQVLRNVAEEPEAIFGEFPTPDDVRSFDKEDIVYALGSKWKQAYLTRVGDEYYVLPAEWVVATSEWQAFHPERSRPTDWLSECAACHVTGLDVEEKTFAEAAVACEACHGPGRLHATTADKTKIINPADLSFELQAAVCGRCHIRGEDASGAPYPAGFEVGHSIPDSFTPVSPDDDRYFWPDGTSRRNYQQYLDWQQSQHSQGQAAGCTDCHEVHGTQFTADVRVEGNELCTGCHQDKADVAAHTPYMTAPLATCVDCHMPKLATSAVPYDISTHTFRSVELAQSLELGIPNACNLCHDREIGGIPAIPHVVEGRGSCLLCHEATMPRDHQGRTSDYCISCHQPAS